MKRWLIWIVAVLAVFWLTLLRAEPARAAGPPQQAPENEACLACHSRPNLSYTFPSGEVWSLYVDPDGFHTSVHGNEVACTDCHKDITGYPHPPLEANSIRTYEIQHIQLCRDCHAEAYGEAIDGVHAREIAAGNWDAAICTDCHTAHETVDLDEQPRSAISQICSQCHSAIFNQYVESVHGEALTTENNPDVPSCIDCHKSHIQEDPRTEQFRLNSPNLCATCHADEELMEKYDISTHVFDTYVSDFHGTTVTLFERVSPDLPTNKAVCYDCHGVHNMRPADDPESLVFRENLLQTCQRCHPDATENFPTSWMSHYEPDLEKYPMVYFVELFYDILIPAIIGFMAIVVAFDIGSRFTHRLRQAPEETEESSSYSNTDTRSD
jgi:predicted CXXCH cytochrome family protein